ncbi:uncharacterized protein LOC115688785 [Syzygium oleosum]|uniref:uncharacterized protein LOC115688785 n=1 Tax=Syzygium oleosum TaxID=219896 RepID=UPI0024BB4F18|nr:uncharacterized protein LOC115688785 [Syzygium oleosum]
MAKDRSRQGWPSPPVTQDQHPFRSYASNTALLVPSNNNLHIWVAYQYRALQEIPPPLKTEMFQARFTRTDYDYFDEICAIEIAWSECRPERIVVPKKLNGEEEIYHASTFYIRNHRIPTILRPLVPEVTDKPT